MRRALDVYYFPGMWEWPRSIVTPLVHEALDRALHPADGAAPAAAADVETGHRLLDAYAIWAADHDHFTPIQVATEVEVTIPDPVLFDRDLATTSGRPVKFCTCLDALVFGQDDRPWLLCHRLGPGTWVPTEVLGVEEEALTDCWAWAHFALDPRMAGVMFNEARLDAPDDPFPFRRTVVPATRGEIAGAGRQLGREALEMLDAGLVPYPNPTPANCVPCPFLAPCRALREGRDPAQVLAQDYERAAPETPREGRLGGHTWSVSRGARPNRFDS